MKIRLSSQQAAAMTLVEFLVVLVLVLVLAGLVVPTCGIGGRKRPSTYLRATKDMADLQNAISVFLNEHSYLPVSPRTAALTNGDFTFGTFQTTTNPAILNGMTPEANNSEVMRILTAWTPPAGTASDLDPLQRNPRATRYFHAKETGDTRSPGLGSDGVLRDPWGHPYILTLDLDGDGRCKDALYRKAAVSRVTPPPSRSEFTNSVSPDGLSDDYTLAGKVMIWSFGPDGQASPTERADRGVNRDNVRGWR